MEETEFRTERKQMVLSQIASRGVHDERLLQAMLAVPRHLFVPQAYWHAAYSDGPLPIGHGQTISQPYIVARMTQLLELEGGEKVLEIGTGSGYQAAILGSLVSEVHTIERHAALAQRAASVLEELGLSNVHVHIGDGSLGLPELAPFQAILVTAAAPETPQALLEQLDAAGRLVIPVGERQGQYLCLWHRKQAGFTQEIREPVAFVPLRGRFGWDERAWEE